MARGGQALTHGSGGTHRAFGIVYMAQRRQAQHCNERGALVIDADLVNAALEAIQRHLQGLHRAVGVSHWRVGIERRQIHEDHRQAALLAQPVGLVSIETRANCAGNVASECRCRNGQDIEVIRFRCA